MKNNFFAGLRTILPFLLFILLISWILGILFDWIESIESLIPQSTLDSLNMPKMLIRSLELLILCIIVCIIGMVARRPRMSKKFKAWLEPAIYRVPLLSHLFKITNQVTDTLKDADSFKKVVLVRFPMETTWSVGFITGENPESFRKVVGDSDLVSIFIPTTPNPTNGYLVLMNPKDFIDAEVPVSLAITFIISMGAAGAASKIIEESHPNLGWGFL